MHQMNIVITFFKCGIERYAQCTTRNEGQHVLGKEHMA